MKTKTWLVARLALLFACATSLKGLPADYTRYVNPFIDYADQGPRSVGAVGDPTPGFYSAAATVPSNQKT